MLLWLSLTSIYFCSKSSHSALVNSHTLGFPVYILQPRLQDGLKLPKWEHCSIRVQYMDVSPLHTITVGLIRNLNTNCMSPQFHVVYENLFQTVHSYEGKPPTK